MTIAQQFAAELREQAESTRKVLQRIPTGKLSWKPHEKSTAIGRLGMHIAEQPGTIIRTLTTEGIDFAAMPFKPVFPNTAAEIIDTFEKTLKDASEALEKYPDDKLSVMWVARRGEQIAYQMPRSAVVRRTLNHIIHHRGQLTVYLRLLDVPVPPTFGPTADER